MALDWQENKPLLYIRLDETSVSGQQAEKHSVWEPIRNWWWSAQTQWRSFGAKVTSHDSHMMMTQQRASGRVYTGPSSPFPNIAGAWKWILITVQLKSRWSRPVGTRIRLVMKILMKVCAGVEANLNGSKCERIWTKTIEFF